MRLIDADALIKYIEDENKQIIAENGKKARDTDAYKMSLVIIEVIKTFNTAYDIDKVRVEVIDELLDISWHSIDLKDFRREVMKLKEQNK